MKGAKLFLWHHLSVVGDLQDFAILCGSSVFTGRVCTVSGMSISSCMAVIPAPGCIMQACIWENKKCMHVHFSSMFSLLLLCVCWWVICQSFALLLAFLQHGLCSFSTLMLQMFQRVSCVSVMGKNWCSSEQLSCYSYLHKQPSLH